MSTDPEKTRTRENEAVDCPPPTAAPAALVGVVGSRSDFSFIRQRLPAHVKAMHFPSPFCLGDWRSGDESAAPPIVIMHEPDLHDPETCFEIRRITEADPDRAYLVFTSQRPGYSGTLEACGAAAILLWTYSEERVGEALDEAWSELLRREGRVRTATGTDPVDRGSPEDDMEGGSD